MTEPGSRALRTLSPVLPYLGVLSGYYLLSSGWAAIGLYHLAIVVVLTASQGWSSARTLVRGRFKALGFAMGGSCLASGVALYLLWPLARLEGITLASSLTSLGLEGGAWIAFIAYYTLVNPWVEEVYWRGWYPEQLRFRVVSDLLFAGYHVFVVIRFVGSGWAVFIFLALVAAAFIWRQIAARSGGLILPVSTHLLADASVIGAAVLLMSR